MKKKEVKGKEKKKKLEYIHNSWYITYITYTKFYPMYSIYINYFKFITFFGYDNLVHWINLATVLRNEKLTHTFLRFLDVKHRKLHSVSLCSR